MAINYEGNPLSSVIFLVSYCSSIAQDFNLFDESVVYPEMSFNTPDLAPRLMAVRGATTVPENKIEAIELALTHLLESLVKANPVMGHALQPHHMVSVFFTVTPDITAISVAKVARLSMGWDGVAMMCAQEP